MSLRRIGNVGWQDMLDVLRCVDCAGVAEAGLYVLFNDEIPDDHALRCVGGCAGCTSPFADLELRGVLEKQRRWIGRAPTIVIRDRTSFENAVCILLHEWSHVVTWRSMPDKPPLLRLLSTVDKALWPESIAKEFDAAVSGREFAPYDWRAQHGTQWMRCLIHLIYRAELLALLPLSLQTSAAYFTPSELAVYVTGLGDEPQRFADTPLREILITDPPEQFAALAAREMEKSDERSEHPEMSPLRQ